MTAKGRTMSARKLRVSLRWILCAGAALVVLAACSGGHKRTVVQGFSPGSSQETKTSPEGLDYRETISLDDALSDLDALETPDGVDEALFTELKDALREALVSYPPGRRGSLAPQGEEPGWLARPTHGVHKFVSTPPTGDANRVDDLELTDNGDGTFTLSWHYRNLGDYDQNGTVGISDIVPLAQHYGERVVNLNSTAALVDADDSGTVDIGDITAIAVRYGVALASYSVQVAESENGEYAQVAIVSLNDGTGKAAGRIAYAHDFVFSGEQKWYRVVPLDPEGEKGVPSISAIWPENRGDWWMYGHDPQHTHQSRSAGPESPALKWVYQVEDAGFAAPVVGLDDVIYAGCGDGALYAINTDGTLRWRFETGDSILSSPAIAPDGAVHVVSEDGSVYSLLPDGALEWEHHVGNEPRSSPVIALDGTTYLGTLNEALVALRPDGYWKWIRFYGLTLSTPAVTRDGRIIQTGQPGDYGEVRAYTPNGRQMWEYRIGRQVGRCPVIGPEGTIYVSSLEYSDGLTFKRGLVHALEPDGTLRWKRGFSDTMEPYLAVAEDGTLYAAADSTLYAFSPEGSVLWTHSNEDRLSYDAISIDSSGTLYVSCTDRHLCAFYPDGTLKWEYKLDAGLHQPAVIGDDGTLYVATSGLIYAIGEAEPPCWHIQTVDSDGKVGHFSSLTVVNGNPAISYYDWSNGDLKYVRACSSNGSTWGSPLTVDSAGDVGLCTSLVVANGKPAICCYEALGDDLRYVRAFDANGSTWGSPVTVDSEGSVGVNSCLTIVDSSPAISYDDPISKDLKYVRAGDANGSTWETPITVDSAGEVGRFTSLAVVSGYPAISYYDATNRDLKYVRANDAVGSSWGNPVTADSAGFVGLYTSLAVANGNPAITYYCATNGHLKYVRASDASGSIWGTPLTLDITGDVGVGYSFSIVNGSPAITYRDYDNGGLNYVQADDANGTVWGSPITVDSGAVGGYPSLAVVSGSPAISYYDYTNQDLKFAIYY